MLASGVATGLAIKMANMDKPNLLVQSPEAFAKAAVATIGIQDDTFGCFNHACQVSCMSVPQARADPGGGGGHICMQIALFQWYIEPASWNFKSNRQWEVATFVYMSYRFIFPTLLTFLSSGPGLTSYCMLSMTLLAFLTVEVVHVGTVDTPLVKAGIVKAYGS